jgi:hypothetical protein
MIRTVSLWIRINGKFSHPLYQDKKQTRLTQQHGEYYLRCAGRWYRVGNDPLLALDAKAAKQKLLRDVERCIVPITEALPHLNPPAQTRLTLGAAIASYLTTGKFNVLAPYQLLSLRFAVIVRIFPNRLHGHFGHAIEFRQRV